MRKNIAIIGSGISGLGAAYILSQSHNITIYEKNDYVGGHSRTVDILPSANNHIPVDTGFIVFNHRNYPLLTSLFSHLNIATEKSHMSFGVNIENGKLEYGTQSLMNIFAQKSNLLKPKYWFMLKDIIKFNRFATNYLDKDSSFTLQQCLDELKLGDWFRDYYLLAMGSAIWSTPISDMLSFPASSFIRFFHNHGLLTINDQPQWYTVKGGSKEYVKRIIEATNCEILLNCGAKKIERNNDSVIIHDIKGNSRSYDEVILACHSDQALNIIDSPSDQERSVLEKFRYQSNKVILHSDISFMPRNKSAWSSWVYLSDNEINKESAISLSYWMNNLQNLATDIPIIVTLNPSRRPSEELIYNEYSFEHPIFDADAINAQDFIDSIQGKDRLWFCGAYQRYGFHEDGLLSAVNLAKKMGMEPQWT